MSAVPLKITVPDVCTLDLGFITENDDSFTIEPPGQPVVDQLISILDDKPNQYALLPQAPYGWSEKYLGVGFTALCVRWGSYLATLMDDTSEPHPDLTSLGTERKTTYSFISNSEMKRMNIEISYAIYRIVQIYRERGWPGYHELLAKAFVYLSLPYQAVSRDSQFSIYLWDSLGIGEGLLKTMSTSEGKLENTQQTARVQPFKRIVREQADRYLANILASQAWRNSGIGEVHAGYAPPHSLRPHQQRFTKAQQQDILREVGRKFGSVYSLSSFFFKERHPSDYHLSWPETATALAHTPISRLAAKWSVIDTSSIVTLKKPSMGSE